MQYFIDGYIPDYAIAIEFDEPEQHSSDQQIEYDLIRQRDIQNYTKISFVRISLSDWLKNKDQCIDRIRKVIKIVTHINAAQIIQFECQDDKRYRIRRRSL